MALPDFALFEGLTRSMRAALERAASTRTLHAGEVCFEEVEPSAELGCLLAMMRMQRRPSA